MDLLQHTYQVVAERWVLLATALTFVFTAVIYPAAVRHLRVAAIPLAGSEYGSWEKRRQAYLNSSREIYNEGYRKFKNGVFRVTTSRDSPMVVLPTKYLAEVKKLPDSVINIYEAVNESFESKYTRLQVDVPIVPATIKSHLTPRLVRLNPTISEEARAALAMEMPSADDWTEVNINKTLMRIVAVVSGRVFVGPELCRNEAYIEAAINYTVDVIQAQIAVQRIRPWLRPFLASRQPEVKRLAERMRVVQSFLKPVIDRRTKEMQDPGYERPDDMLQWLLEGLDKFKDSGSQDLANTQMILAFAAIHTTTLTATNAFYDLASSPEFADQIRQEVLDVLASNGGQFSSQALQSMKMLDSALKETLRLHPLGMGSMQRKVIKEFTLSDGQVIPAGVTIEFPAVAINSDADLYPDADRYDPLRFYNLRQKARVAGSVEGAATNQFVSISQNYLTFGYGRHACPGRFFAANEIKMIVAHALLKYDFKLPEGTSERYPNIEFAATSVPDGSKTLLCRVRG